MQSQDKEKIGREILIFWGLIYFLYLWNRCRLFVTCSCVVWVDSWNYRWNNSSKYRYRIGRHHVCIFTELTFLSKIRNSTKFKKTNVCFFFILWELVKMKKYLICKISYNNVNFSRQIFSTSLTGKWLEIVEFLFFFSDVLMYLLEKSYVLYTVNIMAWQNIIALENEFMLFLHVICNHWD